MKVLVLTGIEELERTFRQAGPHDVHISYSVEYHHLMSTLSAIEDVIFRDDFDALVINRYLDQSEDGKEIVELFRCIKKERPEFRMILILSEYDKRVVYPLVKAGIYDLIISSDIKCSSIVNLLDEPAEEFDFKAYEVSEEKESGINIQVPSFKRQEKWKSKKVITVYSPYSKGATSVAISLAKALSKKSDKVCLVDFDYLRPSIKERLKLKNKEGLEKALELARQDSITAKNIFSTLTDHQNFKVLTGLYDLNESNNAKATYFKEIIESLKSNFEFVIIDVHSYQDLEPTYIAFQLSDIIYTVTTGDKETLLNTNRYLEMFTAYEDVKEGVLHCIINNYGGYDLTSIEIENLIRVPVHYIEKSEGHFFKRIRKKAYDNSLNKIVKGI